MAPRPWMEAGGIRQLQTENRGSRGQPGCAWGCKAQVVSTWEGLTEGRRGPEPLKVGKVDGLEGWRTSSADRT